MSLPDEWRIRDIEQSAERAHRRLHELDALRGDVGRLEHTVRELRAEVDGLRAEQDTTRRRLDAIEEGLVP